MDVTAKEFSGEDISPEEWRWVRELIESVQLEGRQHAFAQSWGAWDVAVKQFRKSELRRITLGNPDENELEQYAACLHGLVAIGIFLRRDARGLSLETLASVGLSLEGVEAYVNELEEALQERFHDVPEAEVARVKEKIFGGSS